MKNNLSFIIFFLLIVTSPLFAQKDTLFFNAQFLACSKSESSFFRIATPSVDNSFWIFDYWKDGKILQRGLTFKDFKNWNYAKESKFEIFFKTGSLKETFTYKNNVLKGLSEQFYMNGRPKKSIDYKVVNNESGIQISEPLLLQAYDSL